MQGVLRASGVNKMEYQTQRWRVRHIVDIDPDQTQDRYDLIDDQTRIIIGDLSEAELQDLLLCLGLAAGLQPTELEAINKYHRPQPKLVRDQL